MIRFHKSGHLFHLSVLISGSECGNLVINDDAGNPMVVKGSTSKRMRVIDVERVEDEEGRESNKITAKEEFATTISLARQSGLQTLAATQAITDFMIKYSPKLAEKVAASRPAT